MNSKVAFMQDRVQGIIDTIAEKCPNSTLAYEPPKIVLAEAVETFSNMLSRLPRCSGRLHRLLHLRDQHHC